MLSQLKRADPTNQSVRCLRKKHCLQGADSLIRVGQYELAKEMIETCCNQTLSQGDEETLVQRGEKDEIFVFFLAFKLHCYRQEVGEALEMFKLRQESEHKIETDLLIEVFNVIANCCILDRDRNHSRPDQISKG